MVQGSKVFAGAWTKGPLGSGKRTRVEVTTSASILFSVSKSLLLSQSKTFQASEEQAITPFGKSENKLGSTT